MLCAVAHGEDFRGSEWIDSVSVVPFSAIVLPMWQVKTFIAIFIIAIITAMIATIKISIISIIVILIIITINTIAAVAVGGLAVVVVVVYVVVVFFRCRLRRRPTQLVITAIIHQCSRLSSNATEGDYLITST